MEGVFTTTKEAWEMPQMSLGYTQRCVMRISPRLSGLDGEKIMEKPKRCPFCGAGVKIENRSVMGVMGDNDWHVDHTENCYFSPP